LEPQAYFNLSTILDLFNLVSSVVSSSSSLSENVKVIARNVPEVMAKLANNTKVKQL